MRSVLTHLLGCINRIMPRQSEPETSMRIVGDQYTDMVDTCQEKKRLPPHFFKMGLVELSNSLSEAESSVATADLSDMRGLDTA